MKKPLLLPLTSILFIILPSFLEVPGMGCFSQPIRNWGTYYGGPNHENGQCIAMDANGNVYLAGTTSSFKAISTSGSHQPVQGGLYDAFLVKFNSAGVRQWATYYGGHGYGYSVAVDASGNVYLAGHTDSYNSYGTAGSHQPVNGSGTLYQGTYDAFLVKFNSAGVRQWGTYYGGSGDEFGCSVAVSASGSVYLSGYTMFGYTSSPVAISTAGSHQPVHGGGQYDAFLVKFSASGVRQWGTYYGGTGDDAGYSIAVDAGGDVYLGGTTDSPVAISTAGSHQPAYGGGNYCYDAFLVKFSGSGVRQWATYYGGAKWEEGSSVAVDANGNVYLAGETGSTTNISTTGSYQPVHAGGGFDAYLVQFSASGSRQWATYYGGAGNDKGYSVAVDASGNVFLAGGAGSTTNISTTGSYQPVHAGGVSDAYLVQFSALGSRQWATYYGGADTDKGTSVAVDASGDIFLAGSTYSPTGISTAGSHQPTYGGGPTSDPLLEKFGDAFLVKFGGCSAIATVSSDPAPNTTFCVGQNVYLAASGGTSYAWSTGDTDANIAATLSVTTTYSVTVSDAAGCTGTAVITFIVDPNCTTTGISQLYGSTLQAGIWPNPSGGEFWLSIPSGQLSLSSSKGGESHGEVAIYNVMGEKVYISTLTPLSIGRWDGGEVIDLSSQPSGVYFLQVKTEQGTAVQTLIIHK